MNLATDPRRHVRDERLRWALMKKFVIPDWDDPSMPYLVRWRIVQTPWAAVYLHKIILDDVGRPLHDHPWSFVSIILKGAYAEQYKPDDEARTILRAWGRWSVHRMSSKAFHGITAVHSPTWTLVLTGPRRQVWGFLTPEGWQPWDEVVEAKGA
jgi:hypothetical protein